MGQLYYRLVILVLSPMTCRCSRRGLETKKQICCAAWRTEDERVGLSATTACNMKSQMRFRTYYQDTQFLCNFPTRTPIKASSTHPKQIKMSKDIIIWSARICPYAHRTNIVLREKNIPFHTKEVNLQDKSPQFTEVYKKALFHDPTSTGKVPTIQHDGTVITESDITSWYLAETFQTGTQLIPESPLERAKLRHFLNEFAGKVPGIFHSLLTYEKVAENKASIDEKAAQTLEAFDKAIVGPYVLGENFTLADVLVWPWFDRWNVLTQIASSTVNPKNYANIHKWSETLRTRESVKQTSPSQEELYQAFKKFAS